MGNPKDSIFNNPVKQTVKTGNFMQSDLINSHTDKKITAKNKIIKNGVIIVP